MSGAECEACANPGQGLTHTCPGSGTFLAAEAHVAGEVEEIAEAWPTWEVRIGLRLRAPDQDAARSHLTHLMRELLDDALVQGLDFALAELNEVEA